MKTILMKVGHLKWNRTIDGLMKYCTTLRITNSQTFNIYINFNNIYNDILK